MQRSLRFIPAVCLFLTLAIVDTPYVFPQSGSGVPSAPNVTLPGPQNPFLGSAPEGKATGEVLQIDFKEAIDRGLRNNLGLLLAVDQTEAARGEKWKELSALLPDLSGHVIENAETESLAALGFDKLLPLLSPPGTNLSKFPRVTPAFNYFDARLTQAPEDAKFALAWVTENARTREQQELAIAALSAKCDILWAQLDAIHHAYVTPGWPPPGAFQPA